MTTLPGAAHCAAIKRHHSASSMLIQYRVMRSSVTLSGWLFEICWLNVSMTLPRVPMIFT